MNQITITDLKCHTCQTVKPISEYYTAFISKYKCKDCVKETSRLWRATNREKSRQHSVDWRARKRDTGRQHVDDWMTHNRITDTQRSAKWRVDNPDKARQNSINWRDLNMGRLSEYNSKWAATRITKDPLIYRAKNMIMNMAKRVPNPDLDIDHEYFSVANVIEMLKTNTHCPFCKVAYEYSYFRKDNPNHGRLRANTPTIDRIVAGGNYTKENTHMICHSCNCRKGNGTIEDLKKRLLLHPRIT